MIRVSSNSPATSCGGAASRRKVCAIWSARRSWIRETLILCNRSRSVTKHWGAMPRRSLRWNARQRSCPTTPKRGPIVNYFICAGKRTPGRCARQLMQSSRKDRAPSPAPRIPGSFALWPNAIQRRAIALTPLEKDVINGSRVLQYFAITAAWAGDKEVALQQLEAGLRAPFASLMLSYGALKLFPVWDPLRGDPRFEKIVAALAPKDN